MNIRNLKKLQIDLHNNKKHYKDVSSEADTIFEAFKKKLPFLKRSTFPSKIEIHISSLVAEWENLYMRIKQDCKDRAELESSLN